MVSKSKILAALAAVSVVGAAVFAVLDRNVHFIGGHGRVVDDLISRNAAARGGADAWRAVTTLRLAGEMDLGQKLHVPYVLEQKRPGKMCLEFEFNEKTALQCVNGKNGWKQLPFMGRAAPEAMTEAEMQEIAGTVDPEGLLLDSYERGFYVELVGHETVDGRSTSKLQVTLPSGSVRWVYLDDKTALEVKLEAMRKLRGRERLMETTYSDWASVDGLLIPRRQETRYHGEAESHFITVENVSVNPPIDDQRFAMPASGVKVNAS
jgi:hypothetical protein